MAGELLLTKRRGQLISTGSPLRMTKRPMTSQLPLSGAVIPSTLFLSRILGTDVGDSVQKTLLDWLMYCRSAVVDGLMGLLMMIAQSKACLHAHAQK